MEKSHKSAVVLIPPEDVWPQIQKIRQKYDKAYERWMPHINLLYPFMNSLEPAFKEAPARFEKALQCVQPFKITFNLDSFGHFKHGKNATVWLKPITEGVADVGTNAKTTAPVTFVNKPSQPPAQGSALKMQEAPSSTIPSVFQTPTYSYQTVPSVHSSSGNAALSGYQPPVTTQAASASTGLDALKDAIWGLDTEKPEQIHHEPSMDNLRFAFVGDDRENERKPYKELNKTEVATESCCNSDGFQINFEQEVTYSADTETTREQDTTSYESVANDKQDRITFGFFDLDESDGDKTECVSVDHVHDLQAVLESVYPAFDDLSSMSEKGFQPHLTLGQCQANDANKFIQDLQDSWKDISFVASEVCLLQRKGQLDPFEVAFRVTLGDGSALSSKTGQHTTL